MIARIVTLLLTALCITSTAEARPVPESFADLVDTLSPAVVNISTAQVIEKKSGDDNPNFSLQFGPNTSPEDLEKFFERFGIPDLFDRFNPEGDVPPGGKKNVSLGSGFIIDPSGYIVTNHHVIDKADEVTVLVGDNKTFTAKVIGSDAKTDLALLKIDVDYDLPFVKFGNSDNVRVGDWVLAIGNPFGLGGTVTAGIISARARDINSGPFDDFLQTDASINRGNSGGPMFNMQGEVIGINSVIFSPSGGSVGIGFSIPSALAEPIITQLRNDGKVVRSWLGVKIRTVSEDVAESLGLKRPRGAFVEGVTKGGPAEKAGIKPGDIILSFDNQEIIKMRELPRVAASAGVNKSVDVVVWRNNAKKRFKVTLGTFPEENTKSSSTQEQSESNHTLPKGSKTIIGLTLVPITETIRSEYNLDDTSDGLLVLEVNKDKEVYQRGIRPGDRITAVNQDTVYTIAEFKKALKKAKKLKRKFVLLRVHRSDEALFLAVPTS